MLRKTLSIAGIMAMFMYLFPLVPPQYSPVEVDNARALTDPGKFTSVSASLSSTTKNVATSVTVSFTTDNALSGSGNGDVIRVNFDRFHNESNPSLASMTVDGAPFSGYYDTYSQYFYSGYLEVYLDTTINADSAISMEFSGMKNSEFYHLQWISIVSFSPDNGGTAYEKCVDAGGGQTYGDCTPYRVNLPLGTPRIQGQLLGPVGTADANTGPFEAYVNVWNDNNWAYAYSDHLGKFYVHELGEGDDFQMDFNKPWGVGYQYTAPANLTGITVTEGVTNDLGVLRFRKPAATGVIKSQATGQPIENVYAMFMNNPTPSEQTGENGVFYLSTVSSGTYTVWFDTSSVSGDFVAPDPITITVTEGSTYNMGAIYLATPMKQIKGYVSYPNGNPVTDASVQCSKPMGGDWRSDNTNSSGYFELLVGKGSWQCMPERNWDLIDHEYDWVNFDMPVPITFAQANNIIESKTQNFQVTKISSTIQGRILKPNGQAYTGGGLNVDIYTQTGYGNWAQVNSNGTFSAGVPAGTYQVMVNLWDDNWGGPNPQTVTVAANSTKNLGNLYLVPKSATISGTVADTAGNGLANQYIDCFVAGQWGKWASGQTDSNGDFSLKAFGAATYQCSPMSDMGGWGGEGGDSYMYLGAPVSAALSGTSSTASGIDFEMARADATVNITAVDGGGDQVTVFGYAFVDQGGAIGGDMMMGPGVGTPIDNGTGSFKIPSSMCTASSPCNMNVATPPGMGAEYSSAGAVSFYASANAETNVDIPMLPHNATVSGQIQDSDGNAISNVGAMVFADNNENMMFTETLVENDGSYSMSLAAGDYNMGAWLDPSLGYIAATGSVSEVTAVANKTVTKNITLREIDSTINVTVLSPNGDPMPGVFVDASTSSGMHQAGDPGMMGGPMMMGSGMMGQMTDSNGSVAVGVPGGTSVSPITYYISASLPPGYSYINPTKQTLSIVSGDETSITLMFRESDATVSGSVAVDGNATGAYVTAWAEEGGSVEDFAFGGSYSLNVTQGDTWHITAKSKVGSDFYKSKEVVITPDSTMKTLDLALRLVASNIPDPVTATFSANNPAVISLDDGSVTVNVPANAVSSDSGDTVKITVAPNYEVPDTDTDKVPTYGVEITAYKNNTEVESQFNSNVTISQCWNEDQMDNLGLDDNDLNSKYWDGDVGAWKTPGSVATDADQNCQTSSVSHLTTFSLTASELSAPSLTITSPADNGSVASNAVIVAGTVSDPTAAVSIALAGDSIGTISVDAVTGAFSETVSGLVAGANTITIDAENGVGSAETVTRTVIYSSDGDNFGAATGIELALVTMPEDGGPQVRIFDNTGTLLESFFAYNENLRGKFSAITADVTGDGDKEIITFPSEGFSPHVRVFDKRGQFIDHFFAYQQDFRGGVQVKAGDVTGDGVMDIVVMPEDDGGPNLRVFSYDTDTAGFSVVQGEMVYDLAFRGAVNYLVTDVTGDTVADVVLVPAEEGGPNVRVYTYDADTGRLTLRAGFMAFQETFRGGVAIAAANVAGDGIKEIIVAPAGDGGPNIRVYQYNSTEQAWSLLDWFWAYQQSYRDGLELTTLDMNNDGLAEIITTPKNGSTNIRAYTYDSDEAAFTLLDWFWAYGADFRGGVNLDTANIDGSANHQLVTIPQHDGGPNVRVYQYNDETGEIEVLDWIMAYHDAFRGSVDVTVTDLEGDGSSEIITTPLTMGGPNVRIHNYSEGSLYAQYGFMAYADTFRGGVRVIPGY